MAALESPTPSLEQILIWYREIQTFQQAKYAASTQYNSTQTLNSVAETHLTKETGTSSRSRFPKIVLRDTKGKELDTDSVYQQALYEAKWRQTHGEQPINPEEWRLPHGKLPARPDFSRHAPYLRPNQPGRKKKKHSRHRTCPASLPGSLRDFFEANDPQYLQTSQSMQTLDTLNTYQSLPSIPQAVRKEKKTKDKSFMQIVQTVRFHAKDVSEIEKRDKEYVPPELCTFCQRMLSDNMLCPSCMGNRHHVHETWHEQSDEDKTHLKPVRTGGGWTFFKRGFGVGPEELYEYDHKDDEEGERNETKTKPFHLHTEELRRKKLEQGEADVHYEHAHEGKPGSSVYYEDTDYPDLDQYGVTIKVSKIQDGPVKEVAQPGEELGPWIAVEGTGKNATGVTEENSKERGKLYQAPAAFRLKKREGGDTVAVDPFSKNRQFNLPKGTGLDIKKSDKELTKFVEIKRDVKYKEPEPFGLKETDHNQEPWEQPLRPVEEEKVPAIAASTPASSATVDSVTVPGTPVDSDVNPIAHVDSAKEEPLTSTPRVVEVPATPDKRQGTPDSGVESSPVPPANSVADFQVLPIAGQLEASHPIPNNSQGSQTLNQHGSPSQYWEMAPQSQSKHSRQSNAKTKDANRPTSISQLSPRPIMPGDKDSSQSNLSPRLKKSGFPILSSPIEDMALTAGIPILGAMPSRQRFKAPVQIPPGVQVPSYILNAVVKSYSDDQLIKKPPAEPPPVASVQRNNTLPPPEPKPLITPDLPPKHHIQTPLPSEQDGPESIPDESPQASPSPSPPPPPVESATPQIEAENESESHVEAEDSSQTESSIDHDQDPIPPPVSEASVHSETPVQVEVQEEVQPVLIEEKAPEEEKPEPIVDIIAAKTPEPEVLNVEPEEENAHDIVQEIVKPVKVSPTPPPPAQESPLPEPDPTVQMSPEAPEETVQKEPTPVIIEENDTTESEAAPSEPSIKEEPVQEPTPTPPVEVSDSEEPEEILSEKEAEPMVPTPVTEKEESPKPDSLPVESRHSTPVEEPEPEPEPEQVIEVEVEDAEEEELVEEEKTEEEEEEVQEQREDTPPKEQTPVPVVEETPKSPIEEVKVANEVVSSSESDFVRVEEEFSVSAEEEAEEQPEVIEEPVEAEPEIQETQEAEQQTESIPPKSPSPTPLPPQSPEPSPSPTPIPQTPLLITQVPMPKSESPSDPPESIKNDTEQESVKSEKEPSVVDSGPVTPVQAPLEKSTPKKIPQKVVLQKAPKPPPPKVEPKPKAAPPPPPPVVVPKKAPPKAETSKAPPPVSTPKAKTQEPPKPAPPPQEIPKPERTKTIINPKPEKPAPKQPAKAEKPEKEKKEVPKAKPAKEKPPVVQTKKKEQQTHLQQIMHLGIKNFEIDIESQHKLGYGVPSNFNYHYRKTYNCAVCGKHYQKPMVSIFPDNKTTQLRYLIPNRESYIKLMLAQQQHEMAKRRAYEEQRQGVILDQGGYLLHTNTPKYKLAPSTPERAGEMLSSPLQERHRPAQIQFSPRDTTSRHAPNANQVKRGRDMTPYKRNTQPRAHIFGTNKPMSKKLTMNIPAGEEDFEDSEEEEEQGDWELVEEEGEEEHEFDEDQYGYDELADKLGSLPPRSMFSTNRKKKGKSSRVHIRLFEKAGQSNIELVSANDGQTVAKVTRENLINSPTKQMGDYDYKVIYTDDGKAVRLRRKRDSVLSDVSDDSAFSDASSLSKAKKKRTHYEKSKRTFRGQDLNFRLPEGSFQDDEQDVDDGVQERRVIRKGPLRKGQLEGDSNESKEKEMIRRMSLSKKKLEASLGDIRGALSSLQSSFGNLEVKGKDNEGKSTNTLMDAEPKKKGKSKVPKKTKPAPPKATSVAELLKKLGGIVLPDDVKNKQLMFNPMEGLKKELKTKLPTVMMTKDEILDLMKRYGMTVNETALMKLLFGDTVEEDKKETQDASKSQSSLIKFIIPQFERAEDTHPDLVSWKAMLETVERLVNETEVDLVRVTSIHQKMKALIKTKQNISEIELTAIQKIIDMLEDVIKHHELEEKERKRIEEEERQRREEEERKKREEEERERAELDAQRWNQPRMQQQDMHRLRLQNQQYGMSFRPGLPTNIGYANEFMQRYMNHVQAHKEEKHEDKEMGSTLTLPSSDSVDKLGTGSNTDTNSLLGGSSGYFSSNEVLDSLNLEQVQKPQLALGDFRTGQRMSGFSSGSFFPGADIGSSDEEEEEKEEKHEEENKDQAHDTGGHKDVQPKHSLPFLDHEDTLLFRCVSDTALFILPGLDLGINSTNLQRSNSLPAIPLTFEEADDLEALSKQRKIIKKEKVANPKRVPSRSVQHVLVEPVETPEAPINDDVESELDSVIESEPYTFLMEMRMEESPSIPSRASETPPLERLPPLPPSPSPTPEPPKEPTPPPPKEPTPEPPKEPTPPPPPPPVQKKVIKGLTKVAKPEPPKKEVKVYKAPPPPLPPPKKKPPTPPPKEPTPPPPKEPTPVPTPTPTPPPKEPTPLPTPSPSPSPEIVFEKDSDDEDYVRVEEEEVEIEGPTPPPKSPTPTPPPPKPKRKMLPKRKPRVTLRAIAKATAPMPKSDLQEMTDPLDLLAKYCIIHPDRMPFYERIFAETIEEQSERYKSIPPSKYSMKFKEKYKNPFDLDLEEEEEQGKPKSLPKGTGGIVTQMSATLGGGATAGDDNNAALPPVAEGVAHKDMDDDKDSGISLPSVDKVKFRDMGLLNRAGQYEFLVGQSAADVLSKKLDYSMDRMTQRYRKLIVKKLTLQSQKKQFIFNTIKEDLPDLMRPDYDTFAKGKGKGKKKNQVLVTEMPSTQDEQQPKKKLTADEIIGRLDSKMWSMISNMPEVTRTDAQLSIIEKKLAELEARMNITDEEKREMEIYTRDLFLKEQIENERTREFRRKQSPLYQQINPVPDVEINVEEVEAALQRINNNLLTDREFQFVYHVLDLPGRHRLNLKLFSAVAALSEKVKQLDPITRKLINKFDFEALDIKMGKCKELFFLLDNQTAGMPDGRIDADTLAIELAAGGITPEHTQWVVNKFNRYKNGMVEFLDFLIYCPLFIEVHERIIKDPLNVAVWRLDDDRKEMEVKS